MGYQIKSFNGNTFAAADYEIGVIVPLAAASNVYLSQAQADALDSGAFTVGTRSITLRIKIKNAATRETLEDNLKLCFERGLRGSLVVTFSDDGDDYYLPCTVASITQDRVYTNTWVIVMETGATYWRAVTADIDSWTPSGTSANKTITVSGKADTKLSLTLTPTIVPSTGYLYRQLYRLVNVAGVDYGVRPWCMTVNTLALVAQDANKCLINHVGGIDAVVTTVPYDNVTGSIPNAGMGYVGTEQIRWTGKTATELTGVTRGYASTTAAAHLDNAEIKVSLVRADLNDYRVWVGDAETKRWADPTSILTTTNKIWININLPPGASLTSRTAVASSGAVTRLNFVVDTTHKARIKAMPTAGIVYHGNEWFAYSAKDDVNCTLTISQRGYLNTTLEAHNAAVTFALVAAPILINYGNVAATAPSASDDAYDDDKPMFDLNASDNTVWVYTATTGFYDADNPDRPGALALSLSKVGTETETYLITENGESGNAVAGVQVGTWVSGTTYKGDTVTGVFTIASAGGIWKVTHAGKKYRSGANWVTKAGMQKSINGTSWATCKLEAKPTSEDTYASFTYSDTVVTAATVTRLTSMYKSLRFGMFGTYAAVKDDVYAQIELASMSVYFMALNIPTGAFLTAGNNATLDITITNTENGDAVQIVAPMVTGMLIALDGEDNIVTLDGGNAHGILTLDDNSRSQFIRLEAGGNDLTITSADMGTLDIDLSWYARRP